MTVQNIRIVNSVVRNAEVQYECFVLSDSSTQESIKICSTKNDGNCLFSAVCHQLDGTKIESAEHDQMTNKLRSVSVFLTVLTTLFRTLIVNITIAL